MPPNAVASIALTANPNALSTGLNAAYRMVANFAKLSGQVLQGLHLAPKAPPNGGGFSAARVALGTAVGMYTKRGIDLLVDQVKQIFAFNDQLVRFGIAARMSGTQLQWVGKMAREAGAEVGISGNVVLGAARAYVDLAGANAFTVDKMHLLARTAQATGAEASDLAQVIYQLQHAMKVSDRDLEDTLGGVINMSKDGAVHFSQMAAEIAELAPQAARYGMVGRKGVNELTAMMQVARTGFGTVSEMGTGITRVFTGLTMHASKFQSYGVRVFDVAKDGTKTWRHFADIFHDISTNKILSKDPELLRKVFGRSEADRTIRLWMEGTEKLRELEAAGEANGVVQQDLATYTESAAGRTQIALEKMKNAVAEAFTPERINAFVSAIEDVASKVGPLAEIIGKMGDAMGALYQVGKKMRGWVGSQGEISMSVSNVRAWLVRNGYKMDTRRDRDANEGKGYVGFGQEMDAANAFIRAVNKAMPDDKSTPLSNRLAVEAAFTARSGTELSQAANSYLNEAGLNPKQIRDIWESIVKEKLADVAREPGGKEALHNVYEGISALPAVVDNLKGYVTGGPTTAWSWTGSPTIQTDLLGALRDLTTALKDPHVNLHLDGNKVGQSVADATHARRR